MNREDFVFVIHLSEENGVTLKEEGTIKMLREQDGDKKRRQAEEEHDNYQMKMTIYNNFLQNMSCVEKVSTLKLYLPRQK